MHPLTLSIKITVIRLFSFVLVSVIFPVFASTSHSQEKVSAVIVCVIGSSPTCLAPPH